jgi:hypothetical protein
VSIGNRGRTYELDSVNPTTASIRVDNTDGTYSNGATLSGGTVTTDKRMRVRAAIVGGSTYTLADHVIQACPTTLDSGGFDYGSTAFSTVDYFDSLAARELNSAYVEQTLSELPFAYFPLGESAGATTVGDIIGGVVAPIKDAYGVGNTSPGAAAFGAAPFWPDTDPTTNLSLSPHITTGTPDGGKYIELGAGGAGTFLTGTTWGVRLTFATTYSDSSGYLFYQYGNADDSSNAVSIYLGSSGVLSISWPGGFSSPVPTYNDGVSHTLQVWGTPTNTRIYIDGVLIDTQTAISGALIAVGRCTVGAKVTATGYLSSPYHGQIGHVALFDSNRTGSLTAHQTAANGYPGETADTRIARVLTWHGFTNSTNLDAGSTTLAPQACAGVTAAAEILAAANADDGIFFMQGDGTARFRSRLARYAQSRVVTLNTTTLPVDTAQLTFEHDRQHMTNDLYATRPNGPIVRVVDSASVTAHRRRTNGKSSPMSFPVQTDAELAARASWYLCRYSQPRTRVGAIRLRPFVASALAPYACTLEPFDRIGIDNLPANAPASSMDFLVESIGHPQIDNSEWITELTLSPWIAVFVPGDATYGVPGIYPVPY